MSQQKIDKLSIYTSNHTAKLWIQHFNLNDLLQQNLRAQRLGNWNLHSCKMLPYFAGCGRHNYTKSVLLHLQQINNLEHNSQVYENFMAGIMLFVGLRMILGEVCHLTTSLSKHYCEV